MKGKIEKEVTRKKNWERKTMMRVERKMMKWKEKIGRMEKEGEEEKRIEGKHMSGCNVSTGLHMRPIGLVLAASFNK